MEPYIDAFAEDNQGGSSGFNGASLVSSNPNPLGGVYGQPGAFGNEPEAPQSSGFNGASLVSSNGNPLGGVYGAPGAFGNPGTAPPAQPTPPAFGTAGWSPTFRNDIGGYNPSQYATLGTANTLAQGLGGNVLQTQMGAGSPFNVPPQNSIDFSGDSPLNAGLLAERYAKYDRATADAMTQAELALQRQRRQEPEGESSFGRQFAPVAGGFQGLGNPTPLNAAVGIQPSFTAQTPPTSPFAPKQPNPLAQPAPAPPPQSRELDVLMQILSLLQPQPQSRPQFRQPFGNSGYYPSLPRFGRMQPRQSPVGSNNFSQQQLLSLLLGF